MTHTQVLAIIAACCLITSSAALLVGSQQESEAILRVKLDTRRTVDEPTTPVVPDKTVPKRDPLMVHMNDITILHQRVPLLDLGHTGERYYLVPGAHFPGLQGLRLDDATRLVMTSFPTLTVRAVMVGEPLAYEFRRDRLTIQYDPFTKRVVNARIG